MEEIKVTYHDEIKKFVKPVTYYEVSKSFNVDHAISAYIDNTAISLEEKISSDVNVEFLDTSHISGYKIYQAGLKYLFYVAVKDLYQDSEIYFLHSVPKGILSEIVLDHEVTSYDIQRIKGQMANMVSNKERFKAYHLKAKDAYNYLMSIKEEEKAKMIQFMENDIITMYRLKNYLNNFYNILPYDTSVIDRFELVDIGHNRIILVCPSIDLKGRLPEYVHYENIITNFMNSKKWLKKMNTLYLANLNEQVADNKIKELVLMNELVFQEDILKACEQILKKPQIKFVLIAGPSSSGKTTTMKRLSIYFKSKGFKTIELSTDDFFVNKIDTPKDEFGQYDFECLEAVDLELFNKTLLDLLAYKKVSIPKYDFVTGKRIEQNRVEQLDENTIVLIEGLHCLNDELTSFIKSENKFKIYLSPFMPLNIDRHNYISTLDLRLIRRLTRDRRERARKVDDTIYEWQKVRSGEEKNIFPYVYQADLIINTALAYELGVLKVYALPLLYSVEINSKYYAEARRLITALSPFFTISSELVPKDSVLREFIGNV